MTKKQFQIPSLLIIILIGFSSCSTLKTLPNGKKIDKRLIGTWAGSENDEQIEGMRKEWEMTRNDDGTFVLDFKAITAENTEEITEEGTWWTEQNKFYEYHEVTDKTDTYNFEILNKDEIKFDMLSSGVDFNKPDYTFIDKRKKVSTKSKKGEKDGLSIKNAIKVKSVSEEYKIVSERCEGCQLLGQSLIFEKDKPFDMINVKNKEGKEVSYYFDISSFYGKF